ncbi:Putative beta-barrel porin-2, OmpL-like. bbp2 [Zhouia amylolytica]|uniref:Putative beta-barrel porin-2, OmpL-like. bbp2 n=1 Tax=Zhouia amylolytica TaxID=376730 RepID=A0A1I6RS13_9FLAO|nr:porin [Zhouia amylolytica]MCQ0111933.1 porin [Zhouia amylolytica]SFS67482.1 Putative beta-barrel porin-2, OmpL-like. bbp2 [Zhouia amylolytica]
MKAIFNANFGKILFSSILFYTSFTLHAQEEKKFSLSGSIDTYFRQNIGGPNGDDAIAPATSFANLNGFALGMANLIVNYEGEKVGFVADLVLGPRGEDAVFNSPLYTPDGGSSRIINQLYAYWNVSENITLTLGNFNTFLGYEVISPVANFNYSTSYMFSYGPFSHTGLKADFQLTEDLSLMLAVMNSTDFTEFNPDGKYTGGLQLGYKGQFLNVLYGKQTAYDGTGALIADVDPTFQIDYTGGFDFSENIFLGINATYNTTDSAGFYGAALYPQYAATENFSIGLRGEYFSVFDNGLDGVIGLDGDGDGHVFAATLTGSYTLGDLMIKPEFRIDTASEDTFLNGDLEPNKSLSSVLIAAIYSF